MKRWILHQYAIHLPRICQYSKILVRFCIAPYDFLFQQTAEKKQMKISFRNHVVEFQVHCATVHSIKSIEYQPVWKSMLQFLIKFAYKFIPYISVYCICISNEDFFILILQFSFLFSFFFFFFVHYFRNAMRTKKLIQNKTTVLIFSFNFIKS